MKAQILKIAGVKSEKEFYKKYPSEEAFMKVHGKEFKKAQIGTQIQSVNQLTPMGSTNPLATGGIGGFDVSKLGHQGPQSSSMPGAGQILGAATGIMDAAKAFKEQGKKEKETRQNLGVTDVQLKAATSTDVDARRQMQDTFGKQRRAMMQPMTGENLFPVNGVGTNVLARNGMMLQDGDNVKGDLPLNMALKNPQYAEQLRRQRNEITEEEEI